MGGRGEEGRGTRGVRMKGEREGEGGGLLYIYIYNIYI